MGNNSEFSGFSGYYLTRPMCEVAVCGCLLVDATVL